jgi:hypothetical protein
MQFLFSVVPPKLLVYNSSYTQSVIYIQNKVLNNIQINKGIYDEMDRLCGLMFTIQRSGFDSRCYQFF